MHARALECRVSAEERAYYEAIRVNSAVHTTRTIRKREADLGRKIREEELESLTWAKLA